MLFPSLETDYVTISKPNAFAICDGMLRTAHCLIVGLPEPELREIRDTLDRLLMRADRALDLIEVDFSLTFEGLEINPGKLSIPSPNLADIFQTPLILPVLKISALCPPVKFRYPLLLDACRPFLQRPQSIHRHWPQNRSQPPL